MNLNKLQYKNIRYSTTESISRRVKYHKKLLEGVYVFNNTYTSWFTFNIFALRYQKSLNYYKGLYRKLNNNNRKQLRTFVQSMV